MWGVGGIVFVREKVRVETGGKSGGNYLKEIFFKINKKKSVGIVKKGLYSCFKSQSHEYFTTNRRLKESVRFALFRNATNIFSAKDEG